VSKLSDEDLIVCLKAGHADAMTFLFDRYFRLVRSIGLRILRDRGEAEDIMQEIFVEIYKRAGLFDPSKGSAKSWILQYAYHRSISRRLYLNARKFYDLDELSVVELYGLEPSYSLSSADGLTEEERLRMLSKAMDVLCDNQRTTMQMACFEGLSINEIAERMGESSVNVRNYYYRGLRKLKDALHDPDRTQDWAPANSPGVVK
jgi:RNA polymerase sigma-70 factor (ECF subfamily)